MEQISVEIIQKCPNQCLHCSSFAGPNCREIIPLNKLKEIIEGASYLETAVLSISGGEPFLHEDLVEAVRFAKNKHLKVYIYTSGIVLDKQDEPVSLSRDILEALYALGTDKLIFDLPAIDEDIYNAFMGTHGRLKYVLKSIECAKKIGFCVEIHFVPTKINVGQIDKIVSYAEQSRLDLISFLGLIPHGRAKANIDKLYINTKENIDLKKRLSKLCSEHVRIGIPLQMEAENYKCYAGIGKLCVRYDGRVFGCEAFKYITLYDENNEAIVPDSIYERRIEDIYFESKYLNAEKEFIKTSMECGNCSEKCPIQRMFRKVG